MQVIHRDTARAMGPSAHRRGGVSFLSLLRGTPGQPDNFELVIVTAEDNYQTPRHRHNFDQVRIMLKGEFGFGPNLVQKVGSVGYFGEGTYYEQKGVGASETLLLQAGGASGAGFVSFEALYEAVEQLKARGRFIDGVYVCDDGGGKKRNVDGYQAAWESINGKELVYPRPRYQGPVITDPEAFQWIDLGGGVAHRHLGSFHERDLSLSELKLEAGARYGLPRNQSTTLYFVDSGALTIDGQQLAPHSAVQIDPQEHAVFEAAESSRLRLFHLACF